MSGNEPECTHGRPMVRLTVKKESKNRGRLFWTCTQPTKCSSFLWDDELEEPVQPPPSTPGSSQQTLASQPMSQGPYGSQGPRTPARKRAAPQDDNDDTESPFFSSQNNSYAPTKRVKTEGSASSLGYAWAPTSPVVTASQPSGSQRTITGATGSDEEHLDDVIERLHELPAYVKKLKRKRVAAEKSSEVKTRKIAQLEAEVARLKAREIELEEALAGQH